VATSTQIILLIQRHFQTAVLPHVSSSVNDYTQCYEVLGGLLNALETKISLGMDISLNSLVSSLDRILSEQKKTDFKFKEEVDYDNNPTKTCQAAVKMVRGYYEIIVSSLDGRNVSNLLEEIGINFQRMLLAHFKKFKVSKGIGGLRVMRDLAEYKDSVKIFHLPAVNEAFEILCEISKIHLVAPENLKTIIEEGVLSRLDKNELMAYIRLRSDFKSVWIGKFV